MSRLFAPSPGKLNSGSHAFSHLPQSLLVIPVPVWIELFVRCGQHLVLSIGLLKVGANDASVCHSVFVGSSRSLFIMITMQYGTDSSIYYIYLCSVSCTSLGGSLQLLAYTSSSLGWFMVDEEVLAGIRYVGSCSCSMGEACCCLWFWTEGREWYPLDWGDIDVRLIWIREIRLV